MSWLLYLLTGAWLLAAIAARRKAVALPVLEPSEDPVSSDHVFYPAPTIHLDEATKRAASAYARRHGIEFVDLIPQQVRALDLFGFLHLINPLARHPNPLQNTYSAGYAVLVSKRVWERCAFASEVATRPEFFAKAKLLGRHASGSTDTVVAPDWAPGRSERVGWEDLSALLGGAPWYVLWIQFAEIVLLVAGMIFSTQAGLIALASYQLQPSIALAGGPLRTSGLLKTAAFRLLLDILKLIHLIRSRPAADVRLREVEARRPYYRAMEDRGLSAFFEPSREDCPWCGASDLETTVRAQDLLQGKPGEFVLERCSACGLIFQNPRLSALGLEYYYGDCYEGLGRADVDLLFSSGSEYYTRRAQMIAGLHEPKRWLDVGTGQGHFCAIARQVWPDTSFDGLDMSDSVLEGAHLGWLDEAIRGMFPDVASSVAGRYDAVSMFHYLEHTTEPRAELRAGFEVLRPGGYLLIEVPNPECPLGRWLGKFWISWLQPQHLHLITLPAIERALVEAGFEPVKTEVAGAHIAADFLMAGWMLRRWAGGWPRLPWRPAPTMIGRVRYGVVSALWVPSLAFSILMDKLTAAVFRKAGISNAYRIAARKPTSVVN